MVDIISCHAQNDFSALLGTLAAGKVSALSAVPPQLKSQGLGKGEGQEGPNTRTPTPIVL